MRTSPSRRPFPSILFLLIALAQPLAAKDKRLDQLTPEFQKWLTEDVVWLVTDAERNDFLALTDDVARSKFIARFWQIRDPQPLTPVNEFKAEHELRIAYANQHLGADAARKGCLTERGRVFVLLGKPDDIERSTTTNEVYPSEMWFYGRGTARLGLPGQIRLIFYRPFGNGEYKLLNPAIDKDRLFPPFSQINLDDPNQVLNAVGPEISQALDSVAPGYGPNISDEIIQELRSPHDIPERIRDQGLVLNPEVRTRWSVTTIDLALQTLIVAVDEGAAIVHLRAELPATELTFHEVDKGRFVCRIDVFGDITDERGVVVAKIDEPATLELSREELDRRRGNVFSFEAVRTLVPGSYKVTLLLQDYGQGKLGRAETVVTVQPRSPASTPLVSVLAPFVLAFRVEQADDGNGSLPFVVGGKKLFTRALPAFGRGETVYAAGFLHETPATIEKPLEVTVQAKHGEVIDFSARAALPPLGRRNLRPVIGSFPTAELAPGAYIVVMVVRDGETVVARAETPLEVTNAGKPVGLFVYTEKKPAPPEVEHYNRGIQLLSRGDLAGAEQHFRIALDHRPGFAPASIYLARTFVLCGKLDEADKLLDAVLGSQPGSYDALVTKGSLQLARRDFAAATESLDKALQSGQKTKELLNGLGEAAVGVGNFELASRWFGESLAIDAKQDVVKLRLREIEAQRRK